MEQCEDKEPRVADLLPPIDYSIATWDQLQAWFCQHNQEITSVNQLCDGVAYCQLMTSVYPNALGEENIRLLPIHQSERAINWYWLKRSFVMLKIEKEIDVVERSIVWSNGHMDFCRWFVNFYDDQDNRPVDVGSRYAMRFHQMVKREAGYDLDAYIANYHRLPLISKIGKDEDQVNGSHLTWEDRDLLKKGTPLTGKAVPIGIKGNSRKEENKSSMWDYDSRRLPMDFIDLDPRTFLVNSAQKNLCFLPTDILVKICDKLEPIDFVNLSSTCRYLHWRIFSFCKCYAPYMATIDYRDEEIDDEEAHFLSQTYVDDYGRRRGICILQPDPINKPFILASLIIVINVPFHGKAAFDRILPYVLPWRKQVRQMIVALVDASSDRDFDYPATDEFFRAVNATQYWISEDDEASFTCEWLRDSKVFLNCPHVKTMREVRVLFNWPKMYPLQEFNNPLGYYGNPPVDDVIRKISHNLDNLEFHSYTFCILRAPGEPRQPLVEYLFNRYDFVEYYAESEHHIWETTIVGKESGKKYKMVLLRTMRDEITELRIGSVDCFEKMQHRYNRVGWPTAEEEGQRWKIETAVETVDEAAQEIGGQKTGQQTGGQETGQEIGGQEMGDEINDQQAGGEMADGGGGDE